MPPAAATPRLFDRARTRTLAAAILTIALVGMGLNLVFPLLAIRLSEEGYSAGFIGASTAIGGLANIVIAPFIPRLGRMIGLRGVVLGAIAVAIATILLFNTAPGLIAGLALRFLFGGAIGTLFVVSEFWINVVSPETHRGVVLGVYGSVLALGFAGGPALLTLVGTDGPAAFLVGAAIFLLAVLPVAMTTGTAPAMSEHSEAGFLTFLRLTPAAVLAGFVFGIVETSAYTLLPVYGLETGLTVADSALLVSAMALGNLLQIPLGILSDRFDRRRLLIACALAGALGCAIIPALSDRYEAVSIALFLWGGLTAGLYTIGLALLGSNWRGADLAHANATFVMLYSAGLVIGPPIVGKAMDFARPNGLFGAIGVLFLAYSVIVTFRGTSQVRS